MKGTAYINEKKGEAKAHLEKKYHFQPLPYAKKRNR